MKRFRSRVLMLRPALLAAAFAVLLPALPARAALSGGGDYELEASVVDNGGGRWIYGGEYGAQSAIAQTSLPRNIGLSAGGEYVNRSGFYNPPHFNYEGGRPAMLSLASGDVHFSIPAGAVDMPRFEITLNRNPLNQPMVVDPALISDASDKLVHNEGPWARPVPGQLLEFAIFNEMGFYSEPLAKRGLMTMRYRDDDADGNVDGSDPPVRVDTLNAWTLDEENRMWAALPTAGLDRTAGTLSVYFGTPGVYALIGQLDTSVGNVFAYPVPFRPNGPNAGAGIGQTGTEADGITFNSVPQSGRVEIYTLDGRLVRKLDIPSGLVVPKLQWDVRTASGQKAASGVYIWRVVSSAGSAKTGKLMVIW